MKLFDKKLSVIKDGEQVEAVRLEDGQLETVIGGVNEGQMLVCEDCLKPYRFSRGNFSTETLCNSCAMEKYMTKPEDADAGGICVCKTCGKTYQRTIGNLSGSDECSSCTMARLFGSHA